ncbi:uncharacterized protein LOC122046424 [Zingiber officinale]|uniref:uncharacterized protein LOC122046424 n=1 Tax=Zingiber officinale TaxID=94328 RepID=UPI001C4DD394|nr:uncharacterized protein LOC122046424 [Zingiber officinale]
MDIDLFSEDSKTQEIVGTTLIAEYLYEDDESTSEASNDEGEASTYESDTGLRNIRSRVEDAASEDDTRSESTGSVHLRDKELRKSILADEKEARRFRGTRSRGGRLLEENAEVGFG